MRSSILLCTLALAVAAGAQTGTTTHSTSTTHKKASGTASKQTGSTAAASQPEAKAEASPSQPKAIIHTSMGDIHCTLFPDKAPLGTANFIGLANGTREWTDPRSGEKKHVPLYDGVTFHRVIPNFMIQGGDPTGTGMGDPGYRFQNETSPDLGFDQPGRLAYANAGPGTNGSQFFITEIPYPSLNGGYTIFGQCEDQSVVQAIARVPRGMNDKPNSPVTIKHIDIEGATGAKPAAAATPKKPATSKPSAKPTTTKKSTTSKQQ